MKSVTFTIAPLDDHWGLWLDGFLLEEPENEEHARRSALMRLDGVRLRGDTGKMVVATELPAPKPT